MVRTTRTGGLHSDTIPTNRIIEIPDDESWADKYNDDIRDTIRDTPRDTIRDTPRDTIRDTIRDRPRDTIRDRPQITSQPTRIQETVPKWIETPNRTTKPRSLPTIPWVEIVPQQKGLTPIANTGLYRTPDEPADPRDCNRYPDSPFCGGIPLDLEPIALSPAIVINKCGQVVGVQLNPVLAFVKLPPVQLVRVDPSCDEDTSPPPPPPPPTPTPLSNFPDLPDSTLVTAFVSFKGNYTEYRLGHQGMATTIYNYLASWTGAECPGEIINKYNFQTGEFYPYQRQAKGLWTYSENYSGTVYNQFLELVPVDWPPIQENRIGHRDDSLSGINRTVTSDGMENSPVIGTIKSHCFYILPTDNQMGGADILSGEYGLIKIYLLGQLNSRIAYTSAGNNADGGEYFTGSIKLDHLLAYDCSRYPLPEEEPPPPPPPPPGIRRPPPPPPERPCCMSCCPSSPNPVSDALLRLIYAEVLATKAKVNALTERIETIEENVGTFPRTIEVFDYDETTKGVQPVSLQVASIAESVPVLAARTEKVAKLIGVDEFPAQMPESLITKDEGWLGNMIPNQPVYENNLASVLGRIIRYVDEIAGQFEIPIEIKDADPETPGAQPVGLKISNIAEGLGELLLLSLQSSINSETLINMATRNLIETGQIKQMGVKIHGQSEAITSFLGFNTKDDTRQMPLSFTLEKTSMEELLKESYVDVTVPEFDEKLDLKDVLADISQAAAITRAVHWRKIDLKDAVAMKDQILSLWKGHKNTTDKINEEADDLDSFINDAEIGFTNTPGITNTTEPYGRPYDQRPRIREIGNTSDTES
ncbi:hypothetical protein [Funiculus sociatus]|uniref:hypothetical protein n=1 Tax=Funiculus sociatus TaxID=450527 RepID=UPI003297D3B2